MIDLGFCVITLVDGKIGKVVLQEEAVISEFQYLKLHRMAYYLSDCSGLLLIDMANKGRFGFNLVEFYQRNNVELNQFKATAYLLYDDDDLVFAEKLHPVFEVSLANVRLFFDRERSIDWLKSYTSGDQSETCA